LRLMMIGRDEGDGEARRVPRLYFRRSPLDHRRRKAAPGNGRSLLRRAGIAEGRLAEPEDLRFREMPKDARGELTSTPSALPFAMTVILPMH